MDEKIVKLGDALMALTTAEAVELQKYLESKGLKPAQPTITAAPTVAAETVKESANVNLVLTSKGSVGTVKICKALAPITGKSAIEVKKATDELPMTVLSNVPRETAKTTMNDLINELGDEMVFELQDC